MSIATPAPRRTEYVNAEMAEAYEEAVESVKRERSQPAHIREARTKALLRWLQDHDKA